MRQDEALVVVTGATRGIGLAIARRFLEAGFPVLGTGTAQEGLDQASTRLGAGFEGVSVDFLEPRSLQSFESRLQEAPVFTLVNNAGINRIAAVTDVADADRNEITLVNLTAPMKLCSAVSPGMVARGRGRIVNLSSIFGVVSRAGRSTYSATKSGLIGFTRSVALDLAPYGILANCVSPGFTDTELTRRILGEDGIRQVESSIPMLRLADPAEIAEVVFFLGSPANTYVTGQSIVADGGYTAQ